LRRCGHGFGTNGQFRLAGSNLDHLAQQTHNGLFCASGAAFCQSEIKAMLKKLELTEFRTALLVLQSRIRGDVLQLTKEALDRNDGGGDPKSPTHIAELGTQTFEQDFSLRVAESDQDVLSEIEAALCRIDAGTFGSCLACVEEGKTPAKSIIPKARLKAIPYAKNCIECERKRENLTP
jgi:DnaK suppressor protein